MQLRELDLIEAETPKVEITGNGSIVGDQQIVLLRLPVDGRNTPPFRDIPAIDGELARPKGLEPLTF